MHVTLLVVSVITFIAFVSMVSTIFHKLHSHLCISYGTNKVEID
jgi:hypothetical protein